MEVITSVNDGEETEYGLILNQEELDVLIFIIGSFSRNVEKKIGLPESITQNMYLASYKCVSNMRKFKRFKPIVEEDLI